MKEEKIDNLRNRIRINKTLDFLVEQSTTKTV